MVWWFALYYPLMAAIIVAGKRIERRYPEKPAQRDRVEMMLGCAVLSLPAFPVMVGAGYLAKSAITRLLN